MRFNSRITLIKERDKVYDPVKGEYTQPEPEQTTIPAKLMSLSVTKRNDIFGDIGTNAISAITQRPVDKDFDYALIDGKRYYASTASNYRKGILYLVGDGIED